MTHAMPLLTPPQNSAVPDMQEALNWQPIPELYRHDPALKVAAASLPSWDLSARQLCDLELLMSGGFAPLGGFMGEADYEAVVEGMRLANGTLWPMPITLDVSDAFAFGVAPGQRIALRDPEGVVLATLHILDKFRPDRAREAREVFGTEDPAHPGVMALRRAGPVCLGGTITGLEAPAHYDFRARRDSPNELRAKFRKRGWRKVVAFQTRNPLHRAHVELTRRAAAQVEANLLLHPVVGMTKPGDVDHFTRVRCYEAVLPQYPPASTALSLLPLAMRMGGPREALWHGLIRRNHGCTHFIVGRDHAGPGKDSKGRPFYDPYAAQELFAAHQEEAGIALVPFEEMVWARDEARYMPVSALAPEAPVQRLSGTEMRARLRDGRELPDWFTYPQVAETLRAAHPPRAAQGFTVFFTGLSGAGKSTIANALLVKLMELGTRPVTLLDGDVVRKTLSSELGFSREHRDLNIHRIGFVASEITKNGGIAICAPIAPYAQTRAAVRAEIESSGAFCEVHVSTPLATCEARDRKGLYALARAGKIAEFTGISDPYEVPEQPELTLDTEDASVEDCAQAVLLKLRAMGLIG